MRTIDLLTEGFVVRDSIVYFDPNEKGFIDTKFGKFVSMTPYEGKLRFGKFFAAYQRDKQSDSNDYVEVLKAIKGQSSKLMMDPDSY